MLLLLVLCAGCDQVTKGAAQQYLALEPPQSWFHDTVRLEYAENTGAFLSLGGGLSKELRVLTLSSVPRHLAHGLGDCSLCQGDATVLSYCLESRAERRAWQSLRSHHA